jgi:hypothetical protein
MVPAPKTAAWLIITERGLAGDGEEARSMEDAGAELMLIPSPLTLRFSIASQKTVSVNMK